VAGAADRRRRRERLLVRRSISEITCTAGPSPEYTEFWIAEAEGRDIIPLSKSPENIGPQNEIEKQSRELLAILNQF
jgi:hypothetical protein